MSREVDLAREQIELAGIELRIAEDAEIVTAADVLRWVRSRRAIATPQIISAIERAVHAVGLSKRIKQGNPPR